MAALTAGGISKVAVELLQRQLVLPRTVTNVPGSEFVGPNGGTITLRVPQPSAARTQASAGAALTADDISEIPIDVSLSHIYHLKNVTDQELTYNLEDFARQVTKLQVGAVAVGAEDVLVTVMNALAAEATYQFAVTASDADTVARILSAREFLSEADAPAGDRYLAAAPDIVTRLLTVSQFVKANESGGTDALRDAIVGRIYGLTVVEVNGLTAGTAIAYHKSGFAFANRAPAQPRGAASSAVSSVQGLSLRQIFQYAAGNAQDQSLVSTFAGAAAVYEDGTGTNGTDNQRFVKFDTAT